MSPQIFHDPHAMEFFADIDGQRPVLEYRYADGVMRITHTEVPEALGRRGIAAELTRTALEFARTRGWKVDPACSYALGYFQKHPEYAELLSNRSTGSESLPESDPQTESERQHEDALLDEALKESFPASDVPAIGRERK